MAPHMRTKPQIILWKNINYNLTSSANDVETPTAKKIQGPRFPRIAAFARALRLQILHSCSRWRDPEECPKIAVHKNRGIAVLSCLVHLPAFAGALTLIILNFTSFYIGRDFTRSSQLQFVAKLHELLMQASIGVILLQYIRSLACNHALPFGALLAPIQSSNVSLLWSMELWSALTSRAFPAPRKAVFALVLPMAIIFSAVVGPSSAVAMIPRRVTSPRLGEMEVETNMPEGDLFPQVVEENITVSLNTVSLNTFDATLPWIVERRAIISESSLRVVNEPRLLRVSKSECNGVTVALATIPSQMGSAIIGSLVDRVITWGDTVNVEKAFMVADILQPMVLTRCNSQRFNEIDHSDISNLTSSQAMVLIPENDGPGSRDFVTFGEVFSDIETQYGNTSSLDYFSPVLFKLAPPNSTHSWITIAIRGERAYVDSTNSTDLPNVETCTTSAFWRRTRHTRIILAGAPVIETPPLIPSLLKENGCLRPRITPPSLETKRVKVEPTFFGNNTMHVKFLLADCFNGRLRNTGLAQCLSTLTAQALSNIDSPPGTSFNGLLIREDGFILPPPSEQGLDSYTTQIEIFETGYGYGSRNATVILALVVLILYCVLVLAHVGWSAVTGVCSMAWDSAASLVGLALQSRKPEGLGYVGVDVHCMETFREMVGIRVNEEEALELVFVGQGEEGWRRVEENKGY